MGLRELKAQTVQREIAEAAKRLYTERGYDATTIDHIAAEVGMSSRSVFRYFPTKEDIVLGQFDFVAEEMLEALGERPADEPVWESLRSLFDVIIPHIDDPAERVGAEAIQRIVFTTPALLARYLEKLYLMEDAAETAIRGRAQAAGKAYADTDPTPRALVGAAFGCMVAAQRAWLASGASQSFGGAIDQAMATIAPRPDSSLASG